MTNYWSWLENCKKNYSSFLRVATREDQSCIKLKCLNIYYSKKYSTPVFWNRTSHVVEGATGWLTLNSCYLNLAVALVTDDAIADDGDRQLGKNGEEDDGDNDNDDADILSPPECILAIGQDRLSHLFVVECLASSLSSYLRCHRYILEHYRI